MPQTVSYDGDPFDVLVLGPPIEGGRWSRGVIVGLMRMEDEKGLDSKVVISRTGPDGRPLHALTADEQQRIGDYFNATSRTKRASFRRCRAGAARPKACPTSTTTHEFFTTCRGLTEQHLHAVRDSRYITINAVMVVR